MIYSPPELSNTDQGAQFTIWASLKSYGIQISMDGRGRVQDNLLIKRLWWTVKHEDLYLWRFYNGTPLRLGLAEWFRFYNRERSHQSLDDRSSDEV